MFRSAWTAVRMLVLLMILAGVVYPGVVMAISQITMPYQANGSLVRYHGHIVGAQMIGQSFTAARFFQGRPSATGYNAAASSGTNYGPTNPALLQEVRTNLKNVLKANPGVTAKEVPMVLVTSSFSGIDPDISPAAASLQVPRVARVNGLSVSAVRALITSETHGRFLGLYGEPRVNVLELNLALLRLVHHQHAK